MKTEDEKFRTLFSDLRREDAARTPIFARMFQAPMRVSRRREGHGISWWLAGALAAAAAVFVLSIGSLRHREPSHSGTLEAWSTLSNWKASTDNLLTASAATLPAKLNTTTDSWIEITPATTTNQSTVKQNL